MYVYVRIYVCRHASVCVSDWIIPKNHEEEKKNEKKKLKKQEKNEYKESKRTTI